jgi:hypothetical protein
MRWGGFIAIAAALSYVNSLCGVEPPKAVIRQSAAIFTIEKTEGPASHDVYVTYRNPDRHLTDVNASVIIQYVTGAKPTVKRCWVKWTSGEKKMFSNTDNRFGRIKKVEFSATAREHSLKDGKETVTWVKFAESRDFETDDKSPRGTK